MVNERQQKEKANLPAQGGLYLVSACLIGLQTRYDGKVKPVAACEEFLVQKKAIWIPVCPEQLGGLATPRIAADIVNGDGFDVLSGSARVMTRQGVDVTEQFVSGAQQVLQIAQMQEVEGILLKAKSPSCGLSPRVGVTAALLKIHGYEVMEF